MKAEIVVAEVIAIAGAACRSTKPARSAAVARLPSPPSRGAKRERRQLSTTMKMSSAATPSTTNMAITVSPLTSHLRRRGAQQGCGGGSAFP